MREGLVRWWGLLSLAVARLTTRATEVESRQVALTVSGVALPVALLLLVTGVSVGLAGGGTVGGEGVDYWIVPESGSAQSAVVSVGGPQLGDVHAVGARLTARADVEYATPVLLDLVRLRSGTATEAVLVVGVVPRAESDEVAGLATAGLSPGDPHFADGSYDGPWTGELVLSSSAAALLDAPAGTELEPVTDANRTFSVVNVSAGDATGFGELPVALVHLAELQRLTGGAAGDQADQVLVMASEPGVKPALSSVYPRTLVVERADATGVQVFDSELPLAMGAASLLVAVVVGVLFAASTMGLAIAADGRTRAVMAAVGISGRSRSGVVAAQAILLALVGGVVGVALGVGGIGLTNVLAARYLGAGTVAEFHPAFVGYGLGVALLIGLLTVPYLLAVSRRTTTVGDLAE